MLTDFFVVHHKRSGFKSMNKRLLGEPNNAENRTAVFLMDRWKTTKKVHLDAFALLQYLPFAGVNANLPTMSGMMSPTGIFASPVNTPRGTPRGTPVSRWNGQSLVPEEDYNHFFTSLQMVSGSSASEDGVAMAYTAQEGMLLGSVTVLRKVFKKFSVVLITEVWPLLEHMVLSSNGDALTYYQRKLFEKGLFLPPLSEVLKVVLSILGLQQRGLPPLISQVSTQSSRSAELSTFH